MTLIVSPDLIRAARENAGIRIADAARITGVGLRTIAAYEAGEITPGGERLGRMATAYGVGVEQFYVHDPEADTASTGCGTNQPRTDRVATISGSGPSRGE